MAISKSTKTNVRDEVAKLVNAGKAFVLETVDFSDPNRPLTCLEVDFPILPVNQVSAIEGNAGKPVYQVSKWWARRRSSVFRAMLIAASAKAPDDPTQAAKLVWDAYYQNHQTKGALKKIKVAEIFMGGGTTVIEALRLGMDVYGVDLNPVAWFITKAQIGRTNPNDVRALFEDIEQELRPVVTPLYTCSCPRGHKQRWFDRRTDELMPGSFDPIELEAEQRKQYRYHGPEVIYEFWAKHGQCSVSGCGHRTPLMSNPVMATKMLSGYAWTAKACEKCKAECDVEMHHIRIAPSSPFVVSSQEKPYAVLDSTGHWQCPNCTTKNTKPLEAPKRKSVELSLLVHPDWLDGSSKSDAIDQPYGGTASDSASLTQAWSEVRALKSKLIEVRGPLPEEITCPDTGRVFKTSQGTIPKKACFACSHCGVLQDILSSQKASNLDTIFGAYAVQGHCPECNREGMPYGGRYFMPASETKCFTAASKEWENRKNTDLADYWPKSEIPFGVMTHVRNDLPGHGFSHWWKMFNPRQLLVLTQLLKAILNTNKTKHGDEARDYALAAFQQYLRYQNMFVIWQIHRDCLAPHFSNNNYYPKMNVVENNVFTDLGSGNWQSCVKSALEANDWLAEPWELVSKHNIAQYSQPLAKLITSESVKVNCLDPLTDQGLVECRSATELTNLKDASFDLVITDPPFGDLIHYSELSDFFYVWLRLLLKDRYPDVFKSEFTPKALEVVTNDVRHPDDPDAFYQRLLTECWREAARILKPGGTLAFTFHHSEDEPWVAVLESLFNAGFYLEATYPIRSDETKGDGQFGSKKIEYDIIHVCRKRTEEPTKVSWAKMRREVLEDVRQHAAILERHKKAGLLAADLQVIRRGKALEYFSRHYGKVFVDRDREFTVREALIGINQLLEEETIQIKDPPPPSVEPHTRQFLRLFDGCTELPRDQMHKFLRGTTISPSEFQQKGWCEERQKVYHLISPLVIAQTWTGRHRRTLTSDYEQAMVLIGACFDQSEINASETLKNDNFKAHPALAPLLEWFTRKGQTSEIRLAAIRAHKIFRSWQQQNPEETKQLSIFLEQDGE